VLFKAFEHGVDVSAQALTKYVGGHSDVLMGLVTVRDEALLERFGETRARMGLAVSPRRMQPGATRPPDLGRAAAARRSFSFDDR
jgi:cystathionine beta-lyase/cystathionine gamma-synthase